ncbi:hypothetical protein [Methyloversatilis sp.]|uniref:hypothetical protein n=1 Tax=Methyloversatilis sp. TaxID=2569862 RepID=UPI0027BAEC7F|nr:hypothetical protein [Methyloversatilis sp.]
MNLEAMFERCEAEQTPAADILRELRESLMTDKPLDMHRLYALGYGDFVQALEALREWRSQRYIFQAQARASVTGLASVPSPLARAAWTDVEDHSCAR